MIDLSLALPDPAPNSQESRRAARDTTKTYVRLAQQRANSGEPLDGDGAPAPSQGGLRRLVRRLWPSRR
jgi:hypothetical protein